MNDNARHLVSYLSARYRRAGTELDELRQRALELVIAGCVTEMSDVSEGPMGEMPPPRPILPPEEPPTAERPFAEEPSVDEGLESKGALPLWGADPAPQTDPKPPSREIEPTGELRSDDQHEPEPEPPPERPHRAAPPVSTDAPPEDVRGAWGPPRR